MQEDGAGAGGYAKESSKEFQEAPSTKGFYRSSGVRGLEGCYLGV